MLYSQQGKEEGVVVTASDITALKGQERALRASEARLNEAQQVAHMGSWQLDLTTDTLIWSPEVYRIFEIEPDGFKAHYSTFLELIHPDDRSLVDDASGKLTHYIGMFFDISEQKSAAAHIYRLAHYDLLTDLPNRVLLLDRCERALARAKRAQSRCAVLFLDLDRFKHINDSLGHPIGDDLLRGVAERLRLTLREQDTIARLGGDEFVVLIEDMDNDLTDVAVVAQKLVDTLSEPYQVRSHILNIGTTIGVSFYPDHGEDVTTLLKHADLALYQAKEQGRGCYRIFETRLTEQASERMRLESDMRLAIERGEFRLEFQPQFDLNSGRLVGAEALLRWWHSERGAIYPNLFIPIAEDTGLIIPIGTWVLEQACRQAKLWRDAGMSLDTMAVNISGVQIQRGNLSASVARILEETGLPASCLELEITETYVMSHAERDLKELELLRKLGVSLGIDDFGTGQSSLGYLRRLPVSKLKIDRSFVADLLSGASSGSEAIIRAILGMGTGLRMTVVAEGVENREQESALRQMRCNQVQGYHYSKPLAAAAFEKLLSDNLDVTTQARTVQLI